jgi:hypothetical protein
VKEGHEFHPRHEQSQSHINVGSNSIGRTISTTHVVLSKPDAFLSVQKTDS